MNYLAHAFLSFNEPSILVGNMMGDFVKRKNDKHYEIDIQHGIMLHRFIDHTTDEHALVHAAMNLFKPTFHLSNGVFVDIFFDYFLANNPAYFSEETLFTFTKNVYQKLTSYQSIMNGEMLTYFKYMKTHNWLYNYRTVEGISKSVHGICKAYPRLGNGEMAVDIFLKNKEKLNELFDEFFPFLVEKTKEKLMLIRHTAAQ